MSRTRTILINQKGKPETISCLAPVQNWIVTTVDRRRRLRWCLEQCFNLIWPKFKFTGLLGEWDGLCLYIQDGWLNRSIGRSEPSGQWKLGEEAKVNQPSTWPMLTSIHHSLARPVALILLLVIAVTDNHRFNGYSLLLSTRNGSIDLVDLDKQSIIRMTNWTSFPFGRCCHFQSLLDSIWPVSVGSSTFNPGYQSFFPPCFQLTFSKWMINTSFDYPFAVGWWSG